MLVIKVDPENIDNTIQVKEIKSGLHNYYKEIGCNTIDIQSRFIGQKPYDFIVDDEFLCKRNKLKPSASNVVGNDLFFGTVLICNFDENTGEEKSLTKEDIEIILNNSCEFVSDKGLKTKGILFS
ncbi:MAG: DUF3846 domain-containing protein [Bacteroides sp.]|nr:DUF3846 domain-containing protein [Bacteroides sp.]